MGSRKSFEFMKMFEDILKSVPAGCSKREGFIYHDFMYRQESQTLTHAINRTIYRKVSRACPHWEIYVTRDEKCTIVKDNGKYIQCQMSDGRLCNVTQKNLRKIS